MNSMRWMLLTAALGGLIAVPRSVSADLAGCQKGISKEAQKLEAKVLKTFNKCADGYQKAVAKGDPLSDAASKCNEALGKVTDIGSADSAIAKAKVKLDGLVPGGKCTDADLQSLGHLPEMQFGDKWQFWTLVAALQGAYEQAEKANSDFANIMDELEAAGCSRCSIATTPPCHIHSCVLGPGSGGRVNVVAGVLTTYSTTGVVNLQVCKVPGLTPTNEYLVAGGPSKGYNTVSLLGGAVFACVTGYRAQGYIVCGGSNPKVGTTTCQDHTVEAGTDECETGSPNQICQPDAVDIENPAITNGGACLTIGTSAAASGDAFVLSTTRIQLVLNTPTEKGPDGIPCTADDNPSIPSTASTIPLTTGQASASVEDADDNDGDGTGAGPLNSAVLTGNPFDCANLPSGSMSGAKLVGAFPSLNLLLGNDTATENTIICQ